MVTITLYVKQQKRHRCIEQSFGLCGRGSGGYECKKKKERESDILAVGQTALVPKDGHFSHLNKVGNHFLHTPGPQDLREEQKAEILLSATCFPGGNPIALSPCR